MKIRRYYGYDCDSVMGFNNGRYIDDEPIEVKDLDDAHAKIHETLAELWDLNLFEESEFTHDVHSIELTTGYFNEHGELTRKEFLAIDDPDGTKTHYSYVFVNFEIVED